jgi:diguanylate cyclase (GGDEF)-like protein/PAS domain S-box-containing protein|tara:strand:- start:4076 stop:5389 length:1314 start_codon:yes stop_codon:yes gene_type:complete
VTQKRQDLNISLFKENIYQSIVNSSFDAIVCKTLDGIVLNWNPAAEKIFGYSADEMVGESMLKIFPDNKKQEEADILEKIRRGEVVNHFQTVRKHKSGRLIDVSVTISPVYDADGRIVAASKIARDITEQVKAIRLSHEYQAIVESSEDAIYSLSLDGTVTSWNAGAEHIFGFSTDEILGQSVSALYDEENPQSDDILKAINSGESLEHYKTTRKNKDGFVMNMSETVSPLQDQNGKVIGGSIIARNITHDIAEQQLIWKQANYDNLTGLANRDLFLKSLTHEMEMVQDSISRDNLVLLFLDLDNFKDFNDNYGHDFGDEVLRHAADVLTKTCRNADLIARYAGDEFIILLSGEFPKKELKRFVDRLISKLNVPYPINGIDCRLSASIGIVQYPSDALTASDLLKKADQAMYAAKAAGRNQYCYYEDDASAKALIDH